MNNDILTLEEVAEYLRVSERTVYDWAQKGDIPCGKIGTSWRFKRSEIENWVDRRLGATAAPGNFVPLFLSSVLKRDHIIVADRAGKNEILQQLIDSLSTSPVVKSRHELEQGIFHREQLMSTGIGMGIGIPHVRINSVEDVVLGAALVREGVAGYEALDSQPVKLVFMIVARKDQHDQHLKLLAQISRRLKDEDFRNRLVASAGIEEFYSLLTGDGAQ
ncbi:MAG: PTS sugar transporter subunit IIA [Victivallales bacterium]|nr:PTS sugar transporter subunit IIA [Victivallales bacterium]